MSSQRSHFSSSKKIKFLICIGALMVNQSQGSTVALHQLWLALKPTCAFSVGPLVSLGRHVHVPLLDVIHGSFLLQQRVVKTHQGGRLSTPFPQTGSRTLAMLFARNGLNCPRYSARTCGNKCSWLPVFSSSLFPLSTEKFLLKPLCSNNLTKKQSSLRQ